MIAAHVMQFKRNKESSWENGIAIVTHPGLCDIIVGVDAKGNIIEAPVWTYQLYPENGSLSLVND